MAMQIFIGRKEKGQADLVLSVSLKLLTPSISPLKGLDPSPAAQVSAKWWGTCSWLQMLLYKVEERYI